jgi:hypothetical protein
MVGAAIVFFMLGFAAGLFLFKVKQRWCPSCGSLTSATVPEQPTPDVPPCRPI